MFKNASPNDFLHIFQTDDGYVYAQRKGKDSVAFILHDSTSGLYGLIQEYKPPINEWLVTAFGGSIDCDRSLVEIVRQEVWEEAGYKVTPGHIRFMGKHFVSTQMNQFCYLFLVDVSGYMKETKPETGDTFEKRSMPVWIDDSQLLDTQCWKAKTIYLMQAHGKGIKYV